MTARPTSIAWEKLAYARADVRDLKALLADVVENCVGKTCAGCPHNVGGECELQVVERCVAALGKERR